MQKRPSNVRLVRSSSFVDAGLATKRVILPVVVKNYV